MNHTTRATIVLTLAVAAWLGNGVSSQQSSSPPPFNGLGMGMGTLSRLSHAKTRSISPENFTGEKGKGGMATEGTGAEAARDLGQGWKISPSVRIKPSRRSRSARSRGPGAIQHIWMTPTGNWRYSILRIYWDGEDDALGGDARWATSSRRAGAATPSSPRWRSA